METTSTELAVPQINPAVLADIVLSGDLSPLSGSEKVQYYVAFCARVGLDPATQPFAILKLQGKEKLYCDRGGCAQLNAKHHVSHKIVAREVVTDCYVVTANASKPDGRCTESIGAVPIKGLVGEAFCNAMMKAETKAKRRATLDLLGLGLLDESEVGSIPGAKSEVIVATPVPRPIHDIDSDNATGGEGIDEDARFQHPSGVPDDQMHSSANEEPWFLGERVSWGKDRGLMISELSPKNIDYFTNVWIPKKEKEGRTSALDQRFIDALKAYRNWRADHHGK